MRFDWPFGNLASFGWHEGSEAISFQATRDVSTRLDHHPRDDISER